jgi:hypothetical protein
MESALDGELDDHRYDKHDPAGRDGGNSRNGRRSKTLLTEAGPVETSRHRTTRSHGLPSHPGQRLLKAQTPRPTHSG